MLISYLQLSLRLLARNPFFTLISVSGLSVGFAVFFILWPFAMAELKSDQFIPDHERIERAMLDFRWTDDGGATWGRLNFAGMLGTIGHDMEGHSQIEAVTRFITQSNLHALNSPVEHSELILSIPDNIESLTKLDANTVICADRNFLEFFQFPLISGNAATALDQPGFIAISESIAMKAFGHRPALNQQLRLNGEPFLVAAVFKDIPTNSHFRFEIILSNAGDLTSWNTMDREDTFPSLYFKLRDGAPSLAVILNANKERLLEVFLHRYQHIKIDFISTPLKEIAFSQATETFKSKSKLTIHALAAVSIVVLMMAWMNYINITISRARTRFKEIGARKVSGALLSDLFIQFVCQSAVTNLLAVLIAVTLIQAVRTPFEQLLNIRITGLVNLTSTTLFFFVAIVTLGVILTAGYPAWMMLRHSTRQLLSRGIPSRKRITATVFTTFQYVTALSLIAWIFVMNSQLNFILDKDLGIDKANVIVVDAPILGLAGVENTKMSSFADQVRSLPGVESASLSGRVCGDRNYDQRFRRVGSDMFIAFDSHGGVDETFVSTYKLKLIAGRIFEKDEKGTNVLLSRLASQRFGFELPEAAIGRTIEGYVLNEWKPLEIIGVFEDYRATSFYNAENNTEAANGRGQCLTYLSNVWPNSVPQRVSIKLDQEATTVIEDIDDLFQRSFPGNIFNWYFLDEKVGSLYGEQKIIRNQLTFFTVLAVAVACLGLLGMVANTVVEKTKEISVRKILGADLRHVLAMLLQSTAAQIAIAIVIGLPVAWKFADQYLQKFTDRIQFQWWHFGIPVIMLLTIMFLTVAAVLWRAAQTNPVEALKHE